MTVRFVFDASPLIHLTKAGLGPPIVSLEGKKYTAPAVFDEVVKRGKELGYLDAVITASLVEEGTLKVRAPARKRVEAIARIHKDIHPVESEVIALAQEMNAIAVLDDRVARAIAKILEVRVEGSYGVILRAAARGSISTGEGERALGSLVASGWRCDVGLYAALLKSLKELVEQRSEIR